MIRPAVSQDVPQLKTLWMEAFEDSPQATDYYFLHRFQPAGMLVEEQAGAIRGMLSMLPMELTLAGRSWPARYLFAIATGKQHRGQGISSRLIEQALVQVRAAGDAAAMLVPAGQDLFRFYGKRGFVSRFFIRLWTVQAQALPPCPTHARVEELTAQDMLRLRDSAFMNHGLFARWGEDALTYIAGSARAFGAVLYRLRAGAGDGYAFGEWHGTTLIVKELAVTGMTPEMALAILHSRTQAARYTVRLLDSENAPGERLPFGMWVPFDDTLPREGPAWLSLAKD